MRIPVVIVTGALGSGKTTFLRRSLANNALASSLLLVNEAAEYGVDDRLLREGSTSVGLLANGCLCCTVNDDLKEQLCSIVEGRGALWPVKRIIIETTGLADPTPVIATITGSRMLNGSLAIELVLTAIDCLQLDADENTTAQRQLELADVVLLTKSDLASQDQYEAAKQRAATFNSLAPRIDATQVDLVDVLTEHAALNLSRLRTGFFQSPAGRDKAEESTNWHTKAAKRHLANEQAGVSTFAIELGASISWSRFAVWLSLLLHAHGNSILRIKGLLALEGATAPVLVNCVRHVVYFPEHLQDWPDQSRLSRIVFIVRRLDGARIKRSLDVFAETTCRGNLEALTYIESDQ
ncbi:hypothetical protein BZM26_24325 [Paraburkholderia strydomiana]|nr:hypothetical protein BZM26_24325 [Paraburkholderia strydomiana]